MIRTEAAVRAPRLLLSLRLQGAGRAGALAGRGIAVAALAAVAILGQDLSALVVVALPAVALLAQTVLEGLFLEE